MPTRITTWREYEAAFGASREYEVAFGASPPPLADLPQAILPHAIRLYFDNGGGPCYVYSLGPFGQARSSDWCRAIVALEALDDVTLLLCPDAVLLDAAGHADVVNAALASAARTRDRFVLVDVPNAVPGGQDSIAAIDDDFRARLTRDSALLRHGAAYFPYITVPTAFTGSPKSSRAETMYLPPSSAVAGLLVATDRASGTWKAPVNVALAGVVAPAIATSDKEQHAYNVDAATGKSINVIRAMAGRGTIVWGARTLAGNDPEYRYVSVRRTITYLQSSIEHAIAPFAFEANDAATWQRVRAMVDDFLHGLWRVGGLQGSRPSEAYAVRVGEGETMTAQDVIDGVLRLQVMVAMVRPAEFMVVEVVQRTAQAS